MLDRDRHPRLLVRLSPSTRMVLGLSSATMSWGEKEKGQC